jgi:hypothetical protein
MEYDEIAEGFFKRIVLVTCAYFYPWLKLEIYWTELD